MPKALVNEHKSGWIDVFGHADENFMSGVRICHVLRFIE